MAKKHDERKCLISLSKVCRIDGNYIIGNPNNIGIHRWGMIDFLTKYCGYYFHSDKNVVGKAIKFDNEDANKSVREAKKIRKEHKLTNKTNKKK